jgi:hypothetical protein
MKLLKNFTNADAFVEDETLKGHVLERLLIFAAGVEQRTLPNVSVYDPVTGRIDFTFPIGGIPCVVMIMT